MTQAEVDQELVEYVFHLFEGVARVIPGERGPGKRVIWEIDGQSMPQERARMILYIDAGLSLMEIPELQSPGLYSPLPMDSLMRAVRRWSNPKKGGYLTKMIRERFESAQQED